ncbi:fatty-acyl-CoA synthase [Micromonospora matsumotoense]|uniref:Fatty-acyl-CoA synthase n=1 Tax=Micromonospora matsumotoense TaxID=121616 RepID=A0A1C5AUC0_9ACTN|nr:AMP-binding protein [Micromonospora matsumotoense]SCF48812.1 fatty-acyl-CoA synthase [Micromonospora matsumotoense]
MKTVVEALVANADPRATLTVTGTDARSDTRHTWAELHDQARRMAGVLATHGIGPGSRVSLLGDTTAPLIAALRAVWLRGAAFTVLPLPGRTERQPYLAQLRRILADARPDLVIVDPAVVSDAPPELTGPSGAEVLTLADLVTGAAPTPPAEVVRPGPDDLAILQYTSGSTSHPRGVPITHRNLAANLAAIEAAMGRQALDPTCARWLSWLPLFHDMGLIGFLALPMSRGCPLVLQPSTAFAARPASWLELISRHRATCTGAPNFAFGLMTHLLEADLGADLGSLRHVFSGAEPIDPVTTRRFLTAAARRGLDPDTMIAAYGLAESTLAVSFSRVGTGIAVDEVDRELLERDGRAVPTPGAYPLTRLGRAVPGTSVRVVDRTSGAPVDERAVGHIEVSGPSVTSGYWGEAPRPSPWLQTGDLGYLTDGELVVCGRAKDVLFAAGRNIHPQDVEAAAAHATGVRAGGAAAFGVPARHGERLVVAVETRLAGVVDVRRAVTVAVTAHVGVTPAQVVTLSPGGLPRTSSGKLRRAETRRRYLAGDLTGPDLPGTGDNPVTRGLDTTDDRTATPAPPASLASLASLVDRSTR